MGRGKVTQARNRLIYSAFEEGASLAQLSKKYCLTEGTVREILRQERNLRAHSAESYYIGLRTNEA